MKLLPFYMTDNIFIDAYFLENISKPHTRILLVRTNLKPEENGEKLEPIPLNQVVKLLEDGYVDLKSLNEKKERLDTLDYLLSGLYNPGLYFRKREAEITLSSLLRIYDLAYKQVLKNYVIQVMLISHLLQYQYLIIQYLSTVKKIKSILLFLNPIQILRKLF
nr:hypothetical protein [Sulfolobus islandicus]